MLPNRLVVHAYLRRAAILWIIVRVSLSVVFVLAGVDAMRISGLTMVGVVLLCGALGVLESHRHREWAFLGNLSVTPPVLGALLLTPALVGEVVLQLSGAYTR